MRRARHSMPYREGSTCFDEFRVRGFDDQAEPIVVSLALSVSGNKRHKKESAGSLDFLPMIKAWIPW